MNGIVEGLFWTIGMYCFWGEYRVQRDIDGFDIQQRQLFMIQASLLVITGILLFILARTFS